MRTVRVFYPRYTRAEVLAALRERLPELERRLPLRLVALFGSYARGNYSVRSDIDLLVVYDDPGRPDAPVTVGEVFGLTGIEPHCYALSQAQARARTLWAMLRDAVVLYGRLEELGGEA